MSHVAPIELEVNDLDAIEEAAEILGGNLVRDQKTYRWYGRHVGDYPLPAGFTHEDLGKCDHAINFPGKTLRGYEVGVVKRNGKYVLLWDFFDKGLLHHLGQGAVRLKNAYAERRTLREAQRKRKSVKKERLEDRVRITITL
jgi:hypothetical protein